MLTILKMTVSLYIFSIFTKNKVSCCLLRTYYVPGTILSTLHVHSNLNLTKTLQAGMLFTPYYE